MVYTEEFEKMVYTESVYDKNMLLPREEEANIVNHISKAGDGSLPAEENFNYILVNETLFFP